MKKFFEFIFNKKVATVVTFFTFGCLVYAMFNLTKSEYLSIGLFWLVYAYFGQRWEIITRDEKIKELEKKLNVEEMRFFNPADINVVDFPYSLKGTKMTVTSTGIINGIMLHAGDVLIYDKDGTKPQILQGDFNNIINQIKNGR